jgi:hypothetical protein
MPPAPRFWPRRPAFRCDRALNLGRTRGPNIARQPHRMNNSDSFTDFLPEAEEPEQPLPPAGPGARGFSGRRLYPRRRKAAVPLDALLSRAQAAVAGLMTTARVGQRLRFSVPSFGGGILVGVLAMQFVGDSDPAQRSAPAQTPSAVSRTAPSVAAALSSDAVPAATTGNTREESVVVPAATQVAQTRRTVARAAAPGYRGGLRIDSQPAGAAVFVNNQQVGHTPMVLSSLQAGSRAVRLQLNGYAPWSRAVRVVANQQATVSAQLAPAR